MANQDNPVKCECCGASSFRPAGRKRGWNLLQCETCSLLCVHPQPNVDELRHIYSVDEGYFATAGEAKLEVSAGTAEAFVQLLDRVGPHGRRLIDVGCASGSVLWHLRERGWQVAGVDINKGAIEIARSHGLDVHEGELGSVDLGDGCEFDIVRLSKVLEHVRSPRQTLEHAKNILANDGLIFIAVPNAEYSFARWTHRLFGLFRAEWPFSEAPYHLFEFSAFNLRRLVESAGFSVIHVEACGKRSFAYSVGATGYFDTLKKTLKLGSKAERAWQIMLNGPKLCLVTSVLAPLFVLGALCDRLRRSGSKLELVARVTSKSQQPCNSIVMAGQTDEGS